MKIGWGELLLIVVVGLIVLGPEQFPEYAKKFGTFLRTLRGATEEFSNEVRQSIVEPLNEATEPLKEVAKPFNDIKESIEKPLKDIQSEVNGITNPTVKTVVKQENEEVNSEE